MLSGEFHKVKYMAERLHYGYKVECGMFDEHMKFLWFLDEPALTSDIERFFIDIGKEFREIIKQPCMPYIYTVEENIYVWGFLSEDQYLYIFGPIGGAMLTAEQIKAFLYHHKIKKEQYLIQRLSYEKILFLMTITTHMLTGRSITESEILTENKEQSILGIQDEVDYRIYCYEEEKGRTAYEQERIWLEDIELGRIASYYDGSRYVIGTMARDSDYKQYEYMAVTAIVLATRAAMRGGVPPMVCYETSDLFLQKTSACKNINELLEIGAQAPFMFSNLVSNHKKKGNSGLLVEQCKNYIAKHLYHSFTVQQMADELSINRSHLSRKFTSQTGRTIQSYIIEERLKSAANLLKYSEVSVGQIAEYMQFHTPGRFGEHFKKKYGVSPSQYREQNRTVDFMEKSHK